mgnify:CR=1 FL=1
MFFTLDNKGAVFIEVLVAVSISALITGAIIQMFLFSWKNNAIVWEQLATQNEGRKVIQDFGNELREASASSIGSYSIESASGTAIVFYSNIDSDSLVERIRYFMSSTTLKRGVIKPTGSPLAYATSTETITDVAHDVANGTSSIFSYYDGNFSGAQSPLSSPVTIAQIRMVKISLRLEEDPNLSPVPFFIESKVTIRNLKDN